MHHLFGFFPLFCLIVIVFVIAVARKRKI